jgi:predicted  nucleic acid-binding Zn-ribbon protein
MNRILLLDSAGNERLQPGREESCMDQLSRVQVQVARVTADVENIQRAVTDIKTDLRWLDDKINALREKFYIAKA